MRAQNGFHVKLFKQFWLVIDLTIVTSNIKQCPEKVIQCLMRTVTIQIALMQSDINFRVPYVL